MELQKYNLEPQEQLAVSLYLKSMNKSQASRDAGYCSPSVFNKPTVKAAIAEQLSIRAERLRVGSDWVLGELRCVYDRCMQSEPVYDKEGIPTGEFRFNSSDALKALALIGKHVDVRAWDDKITTVTANEEIVERLHSARLRVAAQPLETLPPADELVEALEEPEEPEEYLNTSVEQVEPEISFMGEPKAVEHSGAVMDIDDLVEEVQAEEKLKLLLERWRTGKPPQ